MNPQWLRKNSPIRALQDPHRTDATPPIPDAETLLAAVAAALTACDAAGYTVKLKHGAVMTPVGYVLPLGDGEWAARTLNWSPFSDQAPGDGED